MDLQNVSLVGQGMLLGAIAASVPGQDWIIVARSAIRHGAMGGLSCTGGIGIGLACYCLATLSLSSVGAQAPLGVVTAIKTAGAVYMIFLGAQWFLASGADTLAQINETGVIAAGDGVSNCESMLDCFRVGVRSSLMNPKLLLWFVAVVFQLVGDERESAARIAVLAGMAGGSLGFFGCLSLLFGAARTKIPPRCEVLIDRVAGALLVGCGAALLLIE